MICGNKLRRIRRAELMDDPDLDPIAHAKALRGLEQLNRFSFTTNTLWQQLQSFYLQKRSAKLRVLDLATGGGDIPIILAKQAQKYGLPFEFTGADISATAINFARLKAKDENALVSFIELDILNSEIPAGYDVIMTSLFTHHLDPPQIINLLIKMRIATKQFLLVNDLVRSRLSLGLVWLGTRILSNSKIVHFDGPASVEAAFTLEEMGEMAQKAGLNNYVIHASFPCRQLLKWTKSV